jgi:hypothetical protein
MAPILNMVRRINEGATMTSKGFSFLLALGVVSCIAVVLIAVYAL